MKKRLWNITAGLILVSFFTACKKSAHDKTDVELLTQSSWKFSSAQGATGSDISAFLQTCQKDNILLFVPDHTGTVDEGTTKCNSGDPQTTPFTWGLVTDMLYISVPLFTGSSSNALVGQLTETSLMISQSITVSGSSQNAMIRYTH